VDYFDHTRNRKVGFDMEEQPRANLLNHKLAIFPISYLGLPHEIVSCVMGVFL
jgi:hypothetical protein